jgi:predicted DNA-binding transcriptional regulator YafY
MKRSKSQFSRLLELDRLIRDGKYPNCLTFASDWEVSQKTAQRDIDFLRDSLKAPLAYDRNKKGFYYEDKNWFMPAITLSEGELTALLMGVRMFDQFKGSPMAKHLNSVASKIQELLPKEVSIGPELLAGNFTVTSPPAKAVREEIWLPVIRGLQGKRTLRIRYKSFEADKAKEWNFNPYHLANLRGEWYVFGSSSSHKDILQLAMPRIEGATVTNESFTFPRDFDIKTILATTFGRSALGDNPKTIRLVFDKSVAEWVMEREWHPGQKVRKLKEGRVEMVFKAVGMLEVQRWVLSWGGDVEVVEPKCLKDAVVCEALRISKRKG